VNIALAADWHLGHDNLVEKAGRPIGFDLRIMKGLRAMPQVEVLIFLGDICIGDDEYWHGLIAGNMARRQTKMWLIRGNHDRKTDSWYLRNGWDFVADELTMNSFGLRLLFTHIPRPPGDYDLNIHGHLHNTGHHPECGLHAQQHLVMSEHDYKPVMLNTILKGITKTRGK